MADDTERSIEQLLRAAAKKRRDEAGAPLELHPADRRLLQGEVARQFAKGQAAARPPLPLLERLWPRFAWAAAIFAVLLVGVTLLLPGPSKRERGRLLAGNDEMKLAQTAKELSARRAAAPAPPAPEPEAAAPASPPAVAYLDDARADSRRDRKPPAPSQSARQSYPAAPSGPAAQFGSPPQAMKKDSLVAKSEDSDRDKLALAPAPGLAGGGGVAGAPMTASGALSPPPSSDAASFSFQRQDSFASTPGAVPRGSAVSAPSPPVATAPAATPMVAAAAPASNALDDSQAADRSYRALAAAASVNRPKAGWDADGIAGSVAALEKKKNLGIAQRFVQVASAPGARAAGADKSKAAQPVLVSFDLEQSGRELRLTDNDGSVYKGYVQAADTLQPARRGRTEAPTAVRAAKVAASAFEQEAAVSSNVEQSLAQNYAFRVTGTNRTLRKKVVFTGNIAATNLIVLPQDATNWIAGSLGGKAPASSVQPTFLPLFNSRITGKVVVGSGKAVPIEALPASP